MPASNIVIKGAREHNLRDVDVELPRNRLICLTGVSGSGKSSLAFDTLYAEGQRRYVESLSSFARQFLGQMPKPDVDFISGLSPSISIAQKSAGHNPRSTVGTITEVYDYLRVLYARVGQGFCPKCHRVISAQSREQILARILQLPEGARINVLAPVVRGQKGEYRDLFEDLLKQGFVRARVDGRIVSLSDDLRLDRQMRHDIEVVVDRLVVRPESRPRLAEAVELAVKVGQGSLIVAPEQARSEDSEAADAAGTPVAPDAPIDEPDDAVDDGEAAPSGKRRKSSRRDGRQRGGARSTRTAASSRAGMSGDIVLSVHYACTECGISFEPPSPQLFSFNSPQGMCKECDGLGELYSFDPELLVPDDRLSFKKGCFELVGPWKEMGRWRRHIYQGVAETVEHRQGLASGTMLDTPWRDLEPKLRELWLWGTGDLHVTFTWRGGDSPIKYGGRFEGIVPDLVARYRRSRSKPQIRQLEKYMRTLRCPSCQGERLTGQARWVKLTTASQRFAGRSTLSLPEVCHLAVADAAEFFRELTLDATGHQIAAEVLKEIRGRIGFLSNVGLDYLTLDRTAPTLSGGEAQRIRLAGQIGSGLVGVIYILDEPSIGLHPRDNRRLLDTLCRLRDMGNTVIVVEHDEETIRTADHVVDFGPGAGVRGGQLVAQGPLDEILGAEKSVTGQFLSGRKCIETPSNRREPNGKKLLVVGATHNNLKNVDVEFPLGTLICVTGVSGSGKSSLVNDILAEALHRDLNKGIGEPGAHRHIDGLEHLDKMIAIDQSPIGRTPRSNPGTYIKVLDDIRRLYAQMPEARRRGYKAGRFSFNVSGGRCEACEGNGSNRLEMDFLADVWVVCPVCEGRRFSRETLNVRFKDKSIADVLEMDVQQALELFQNVPAVHHKLQTLHDVGLDYIKLGQPSPTLSGGEAQRIKLARELVKRSTGKTLYLLDEPTTGLHFADIKMLLKVLHDFVDAGNTVLVVEHNLDVVKTADWIIDLGPEGGDAGGNVVAVGTPEEVAKAPGSYTGRALGEVLSKERVGGSRGSVPERKTASVVHSRTGETTSVGASNGRELSQITVRGARQHNLKGVDLNIERDRMTVFCGPSGSGKSSLAMDTLYAEGQRRYVESLSAYARQFVSQMQKPLVDHIDGLSPAIALEQKNLGTTPRSTVGTVTEVYDYLRILMARLGVLHCPDCDVAVGTQTADEVVDKIAAEPAGTRLYILAPLDDEAMRQASNLWDELRRAGYARVRLDGETYDLENPPQIDRRRKQRLEVLVDRVVIRPDARSRLAESVENALSLGRGVVHVAYPRDDLPEPQWNVVVHSQHLACSRCGRSFEPLAPHHFSFNGALGWCPSCMGLGIQMGANPAALLRDSKLTLAEGALRLWPDLNRRASALMLEALCAGTGIPADVPFADLSPRQRRLVMHGTGEQWFEVRAARRKKGPPLFRFQFKGLYPALEEASRLSPALRSRLDHLVDEVECSTCNGSRLRDDSAAVRFADLTIDQYCRLPLGQLLDQVRSWKLAARDRRIAGELVREIESRVRFLNDIGLEYLSLGRPAPTLSGGEAQRIRLASQLGSGLCGVLYVLDEPTIGLHPRDNGRLLEALHRLRDLGNTLVVVEHDREVIAGSDFVCDFGPAAGKLGGQVVAQGAPATLDSQRDSITGPYLSGKKSIAVPTNRRPVDANSDNGAATLSSSSTAKTKATESKGSKSKRMKGASRASQAPSKARPAASAEWLEVLGARHNNLRDVHLRVPLGTLTVVTGVSGSGKSSLVDDVLYSALARALHRAAIVPGAHDEVRGLEHVNKVIRVDQQPLGNSPTSNPATYTGAFDLVRTLFAQLPESKIRGYTARRFSFNVPGGRCEQCEGNGQRRIEMHFLPDVWVECDTCRGCRYNPETLKVTFHGHSISDVLDMTCGDALRLFENIPKVRRILATLCDVGLDYVRLGQPAPTLSGGEAQRVKLAAELARPDTGRTLYLLDEPTTGLHFSDLARLLEVLHRLVDLGNTVVVIEHNLDVVKSADWVIDMGPGAGSGGGRIVAAGTPEQVVEYARVARTNDVSKNRPRKRGQAHFAPRTAQNEPVPDGFRTRAKSKGPLPRSFTGEALEPVLAAGPHAERNAHDPAAHMVERTGDLDIHDVGRGTKMPWEVDGRGWHTRDRVDRKGQPCRWDGEILASTIDRIHELGPFSDTDWNARSVVEVAAERKSDGWFLHAITGETWILKLKFRVPRSTFSAEELDRRLGLKTLNEMPELPVYGNEPRVVCRSAGVRQQEVQINVHSLVEIDTPAYWEFVEQAVAAFRKRESRIASKPDDYLPWKKLGQKWHLMRKGFPLGKRVLWEPPVLEELLALVEAASPGGQFLWNNQQVVHRMVPAQREPWASVYTKRPASVLLRLIGPRGCVALGRVKDLGRDRELEGNVKGHDVLKLKFRTLADLRKGDLAALLAEHLAAIGAAAEQPTR